jgi:tetratricopeptide (TPR) repeat protein
MKPFYCLVLCLLFSTIPTAKSANTFDFSPTARTAYQHILALRLNDAAVALQQMQRNEPQNLLRVYLENYSDCLRSFVEEDEVQYKKLLSTEAARLAILAKGDPKSPYFLYTQAQTRLLWAMNRAKYGDYLAAFNDMSTAYSDLERNEKKFPTFMPNKLSLGVLHSIVGLIPDNYKWGFTFLSGMNGTLAQGQGEIASVIQYAQKNDFVFESEAIVMYAFLMLHLNNQNEQAWQLVNNSKLQPKESVLACFAIANCATRTGHNDRAIEVLQNRPTSAAYLPMPYLDFMLGIAKMYRGDSDAAVYMQRYVNTFRGRNYIKDAYQKLAWEGLLRSDMTTYKTQIAQCLTKGRAETGNDKNALREAKSGVIPDATLLRARLFFDGGYHQRALTLLSAKKANDFSREEHVLEYHYRLGRVLQALQKNTEAVTEYAAAIELGKGKKYYYACNAALQLGTIYEATGQTAKARDFYNYCLALNPDEYADALHVKAKAGLSRLKKK